jgi:ketosteroid isomerase-like protein
MLRLTVLLMLAVSTAARPQSDPVESDIRAARLRSNQAIVAHDIKSFADSLAPDFVMVRGNGVLVPSRQEYIELFTHDFADPKAMRYARIADKVEISAAAPLAAEHGHWIGTRQDGTRAYGGTYLAMWRRTEAGWKIRSELFVTLWCDDGAACKDYLKGANAASH